MRKIHAEWAAALALDSTVVAAEQKDLQVDLQWKSWSDQSENWELTFGGLGGKSLVEFLDDLPDFVVRQEAKGSRVFCLIGKDVSSHREVVALLGVEFGIATKSPVVTPCETFVVQGVTCYGYVVLYDPQGRVKPGTIITHGKVGDDPDFQPMKERVRVSVGTPAVDHPDDVLWAAERQGTYIPPVPLRKLLEDWVAQTKQ